MKIFLKALLIASIIFVVIVAGGLFWEYEKYKEEIIFIDPLDGKTKIKIDENEKDLIRKALRPILDFVYREATLHNPAGDVLPDQIDDNIKKNIKDRTGL
jgi:hypothetical protein